MGNISSARELVSGSPLVVSVIMVLSGAVTSPKSSDFYRSGLGGSNGHGRSGQKAPTIMVDFFGHLSLSYWIQSSCEKMVPIYPRCVPIHRL
jgi:hypothetical protein